MGEKVCEGVMKIIGGGLKIIGRLQTKSVTGYQDYEVMGGSPAGRRVGRGKFFSQKR